MEEKRQDPQDRIVYIKEKDGYLTSCLKLGCGSIIAIWIILIFVGAFAIVMELSDEGKDEPIQYFQLTNGKKTATIHTGMSKDSVIILLGQPTAFDCSDYWDQITYNYGEMGLSSLIIKFEDGKVSSVRKDDNEHLYENVKKHLK